MNGKWALLLAALTMNPTQAAYEIGKAIEEGSALNALRCSIETIADKKIYEACLDSEGANDPFANFEARKSALKRCNLNFCKPAPFDPSLI